MGYFYKGRHRKPSFRARNAATVLSTTAIAFSSTALLPQSANAEPPGGWDAIIQCESGNRNVENSTGQSTASGYFQFINGTWRAYGGLEFAPRAIQATKPEQTIVANQAYETNGLRDWNASRECWGRSESPVRASRSSAEDVEQSPPTPTETHTVKPGDTLSEIANGDWTPLYERNKEVIGSNPDLIFPGQVLEM